MFGSIKSVGVLLGLLATVNAASGSDVVDLDTETFKDFVGSKNVVLTEFFAPWCGHCKALAPEYEKAATELKNHDIGVAKVDCMDNSALCQDYGISGFPTLLIFESGEQTGRYEGQRKADEISKYMIRRAQPAVQELGSNIDSFTTEATREGDVGIIGIYDDAESAEAFRKVALLYRERISFGHSDAPAVAARFKTKAPAVVVIKPDDEPAVLEPATAGKPLDSDSVEEFVKVESFPAFGELGSHNYAAYIRSGIPIMFAFVDDDKQRNLIKKALQPHLATLKGKANVAFLNATVFGAHAENVNLEPGKWPALVVHDTISNRKYVHPQGKLSAKTIDKYVQDYVAGNIAPSIKSEPVPETQDGPVYILVGSEYESVVLDDSKDVLVEFYAPWCGHCKNLSPIYDQLGELYRGNDNVVIAKIDHQDNEVPDRIAGYPTIKLFPAGRKDNPIDYSGARTLEALSEFIKEHGSKHADGGSSKNADDGHEDL